MIKKLRQIDAFGKNVIFVFLGISFFSFCNLIYQLLIAHKLSPVDFAAFNALLSVFTLVSAPLVTIQTAIAKYGAEFKAHNQTKKIQILLSTFLKVASFFAVITLFLFCLASKYIMDNLKIPAITSIYILSVMLAVNWIQPVLLGCLQGLELFKWFIATLVAAGILKVIFAFVFILFGFGIGGALGAFLCSSLIVLAISFLPLKRFITLEHNSGSINFKEIVFYFLPVAIATFCFTGLVNLDMILVKHYFIPQDSAFYSLAQMVGKIFLFLPYAISIVMFPKISREDAKNMNTKSTLVRSLLYASLLCVIAGLVYNIFPYFVLRFLTGKAFSESIILGRLFSLSMSFFTLSYVLITYFLSIKNFGFIKYLVVFTLLQFLCIMLFHKSLIQVQIILCINAILLFCIHLALFKFIRPKPALKECVI